MTDIESVAKEITDKLSNGAEIVFGESRSIGDRTIITVAQVSYGLGGGSGKDKGSESNKPSEGSGMGMGAKVVPLGFITITEDNIKYRPTVDTTKIISLLIVILGCLCHGHMRRRSK